VSHNLAEFNGQYAMAYAGDTPWHRLGQRLPSLANLDQAIEAAKLGYLVETQSLYLADGRAVEDAQAVMRVVTGQPSIILGTVGKGYTPIQNIDALDIVRPLIEANGARIEAAGALGKGERVWLLLRMPELDLSISEGDDVRGYLLIHTSHDGTLAYGARFTPIRVVCQNTLSAALAGRENRTFITIRHTKNAGQRIAEAKRLMVKMHDAMKACGDTYAELATKNMGPRELAKYIEAVFPPDQEDEKVSDTLKRRRETVAKLVFAGQGAELCTQGETASVWGAFNAVCEYFDHVRVEESTTKSGKLATDTSTIFGGNATFKDQALRLAIAQARLKVAA